MNLRTNALFSRVIRCVERHFRMGEIHWRNDIYLEKRILLFKEEYAKISEKFRKYDRPDFPHRCIKEKPCLSIDL